MIEIISKTELISINATLFFQLISFLIFLFIIKRLMFKPLLGTMGERAKHIENMRSDIINAEIELDNVKDMLKKQEEITRKDAHELRKELENTGGIQAAEIFESVKNDIDNMKSTAEKELKEKITEAKEYFARESEILAVRIMEKLLDRRLSA